MSYSSDEAHLMREFGALSVHCAELESQLAAAKRDIQRLVVIVADYKQRTAEDESRRAAVTALLGPALELEAKALWGPIEGRYDAARRVPIEAANALPALRELLAPRKESDT